MIFEEVLHEISAFCFAFKLQSTKERWHNQIEIARPSTVIRVMQATISMQTDYDRGKYTEMTILHNEKIEFNFVISFR